MSETTDGPGVWESLRRRKLVQWAVAYAATAWLALQVLALVVSAFEWPATALRVGTLVAGVGFIVVLVLAWYHGERGAQRISGPELLILAAVLGAGGLLLWRAAPSEPRQAAGQTPAAPRADRADVATPEASIAVLPFANLQRATRRRVLLRRPGRGAAQRAGRRSRDCGSPRARRRSSSRASNDDVADDRRQARRRDRARGQRAQGRQSRAHHGAAGQGVDDGSHLWSETYDRELDDIFAVQDDIAGRIVAALRGHLGLAGTAAAAAAQTARPEAYDAYLLGRELLLRRTRESVAQGLLALKRATALDPSYAPAWAQLASAYYLSRQGDSTYGDLSMDDSRRLAEAALAQAYRLDPGNDDALAVDGIMKQYFEDDLVAALALHERALARNPNNLQALFWRSELLPRFGRYRDGLEQELALARIDPLFDLNTMVVVRDLVASGRAAESSEYVERIRDPSWKERARSVAPIREGDWATAAMHLVASVGLTPDDPRPKRHLGNQLLLLGLYDDAATLVAGSGFEDTPHAARGDWAVAVDAFRRGGAEVGDRYWYFRQGQNLFRAGMRADALAQFDASIARVWPFGVADDPFYFSPRRPWYALLLREAGRKDAARREMDVIRADVAAATRDGFRSAVTEFMSAELALWDGQREEALRHLPRGLVGEPYLASIEGDPFWAAVRDDPAFKAAVANETARRARLRDEFLRRACAQPDTAVWRPLAASCDGYAASP